MTRRDEVVTSRREAVTTRARGAGTTDLGEAMAPASKHRAICAAFGAGAALLVLAVAGSCDDDFAPLASPPAAAAPERGAADPARGMTTVLDGVSAEFGDAVLAELTGDEATARRGYEDVLSGSDVPPMLTARAALHLAQIELRAGKTREALDLAARARAVAPSDKLVEDGVGLIHAEFVDSAGADDRGPAIGTTLPGVTGDTAEAFAKAEARLAQVHRRRLQLLFGETQRSIDNRINATTSLVALYRAVAAHGGVALVAATYRIGTLYHDLALDLSAAEPPAELMKDPARGLRVTLSNLAFTYLRKAETEYRASMDAPQTPESERSWRIYAEIYRRSVVDVLVARGVRIADR